MISIQDEAACDRAAIPRAAILSFCPPSNSHGLMKFRPETKLGKRVARLRCISSSNPRNLPILTTGAILRSFRREAYCERCTDLDHDVRLGLFWRPGFTDDGKFRPHRTDPTRRLVVFSRGTNDTGSAACTGNPPRSIRCEKRGNGFASRRLRGIGYSNTVGQAKSHALAQSTCSNSKASDHRYSHSVESQVKSIAVD